MKLQRAGSKSKPVSLMGRRGGRAEAENMGKLQSGAGAGQGMHR